MSNVIKLPNVECLHCRKKGACVTDSDEIITSKEGFIVRPVICTICQQAWKEFYGGNNDISPVISIQRNSSSN